MPTPGTPYLSQYMNPIPGKTPQASGGNPFASIMSSFGAGGSAGGQSPVAPSAPRYNGFLDPTQRNVWGMLGRLTGQPTREEFWMQRQGQAAQSGAAGLAERIKGGMNPQQAVVDFINSPEGIDFFTTVPNAADEIKNQLALMVTPQADMINVAPGGAVFNPNTGQAAFTNPTTEVQDFVGLAELAQLDRNQIAELAKAQMIAKQTGDLTQTQQATQNMLDMGMIDLKMKQKIDAGMLNVQELRDPSGRTTGHVIIDMITGEAILPQSGIQQIPAQPDDPDYAPGVNAPGSGNAPMAEPGYYMGRLANPADMVEGAGFVPALTETLGGLKETFWPGSTQAGGVAATRRAALNQIRNDARSLKQSGRFLKDDIRTLESILPDTGTFTSQSYSQAAERLIQYRLWLEDKAEIATRNYNDPRLTGEARGQAQLMLIDIENALQNVPSIKQLEDKIEELKVRYKDTSPAIEAIEDAARNITGMEEQGEQMLDQGTLNPVKTDFKDEAEARAAVEANPDAYNGKTVTIGGKRVKVGVANPSGYTGGPK